MYVFLDMTKFVFTFFMLSSLMIHDVRRTTLYIALIEIEIMLFVRPTTCNDIVSL